MGLKEEVTLIGKDLNMKKVMVLSMAIVTCLVSLYVTYEAGAKPAKDPVWGSGFSHSINDFQFEGSATLVIRGQAESAHLLVTVLAQPRTSDEGVQHVVATHTFTLHNGSITTSDKEIAEPTDIPGVYALNATMKVVSGTGAYEGVTGHLTAHGTMDFRPTMVPPPGESGPAEASFEIRGAISNPTTH